MANHSTTACKDPDGASYTVCGDEKMGEVEFDDDDAKLTGGDLESTDKGLDSSTIDTLSGMKRKTDA